MAWGVIAALAAGAVVQAAPAPVAQPAIALTLAPVAGADGQVATVAVTLRFDGVTKATGAVLVELPLVVGNVNTVATTLSGLSARDALGPLRLIDSAANKPVVGVGDADTGGPTRAWSVDRATVGAITLTYIVPAMATLPPRGPAPPFGFSNDGKGMSAAGHVFLLLPPGDAAYRTTIAWNLSHLPSGSQGISSLGAGTVTAAEPMTAEQLASGFYMAGRIGNWPRPTPTRGFFSAWQGTPSFDPRALMTWTGALYGHYTRFFDQASPPPYGVFLRYNPINAGGGVGLHQSFVTTFGAGDGGNVAKIRITLAHEMFHTFQPYIADPAGLASSWFGEGLATLYQRRLPLRYRMITPADFLDDLNMHAGRYYTSIKATEPNAAVAERFWADTRIRTLPYDRGMLYFATVDDAIRARSGGTRSLDDAMKAMLAVSKAGKTTTNADWEAVLTRELGPPAVADFRVFLDGRMPVPASGAFGPCFRRTSRMLRRYELGFDTAVLAEPTRIVRDLVAGSAAALAGVRDGDVIVAPVPQDGIQGSQTQRLTLSIRRDGRTFPITYLPRGETVPAWQWERVPGVADARCAL